MKLKTLLWAPVLATLAGCAGVSYCEGQQDYQRARSVPELKPAEGLRIPESEHALRIPPPPAASVPYAETVKDADGDDAVRCLDTPPEMPPLAELKDPGPAQPADAIPQAPVDAPAPEPEKPPRPIIIP